MALDTERSPASNSRADALRAGLTRLTAGRFPAKLGANGVFAGSVPGMKWWMWRDWAMAQPIGISSYPPH